MSFVEFIRWAFDARAALCDPPISEADSEVFDYYEYCFVHKSGVVTPDVVDNWDLVRGTLDSFELEGLKWSAERTRINKVNSFGNEVWKDEWKIYLRRDTQE